MTEFNHRERWNNYLIPETGTLKNIPGIKNFARWTIMETELASQRSASVPQRGFGKQNLSMELQTIHHHLFQDCYEWAGHLRDVNMSKAHSDISEQAPFLSWNFIEKALDSIQSQIDITKWNDLSFERKATALGKLHALLNKVHPFRDGNGRVTRIFMEIIAAQHGIKILWTEAAPHLVYLSALSMAHTSGLDVNIWKEFYKEITEPLN